MTETAWRWHIMDLEIGSEETFRCQGWELRVKRVRQELHTLWLSRPNILRTRYFTHRANLLNFGRKMFFKEFVALNQSSRNNKVRDKARQYWEIPT
jgi:hypothetical protein